MNRINQLRRKNSPSIIAIKAIISYSFICCCCLAKAGKGFVTLPLFAAAARGERFINLPSGIVYYLPLQFLPLSAPQGENAPPPLKGNEASEAHAPCGHVSKKISFKPKG